MTLPELVGDYIAKKSAYQTLYCERNPADPVAHELALRDALDTLAEASCKLDEARRAVGDAAMEAAE